MKNYFNINIAIKFYLLLPRKIKMFFWGGKAHYCTMCESDLRKFWTFGITSRPNAFCPMCESLERHRMDWYFLKNKTNLFDQAHKILLHIAPEKSFEVLFRIVPGIEYLSADLNNPHAMVRMDITDIQFPDDTFDVIYCSHVLEHVPDDRKAMAELFRILKPGGWALLQVPIVIDKTYEDLSLMTAEERIKVFGHPEHVRNYGQDYKDRLEDAGFHVAVFTADKLIGKNNLFRYGITSEDLVYYCTKQ